MTLEEMEKMYSSLTAMTLEEMEKMYPSLTAMTFEEMMKMFDDPDSEVIQESGAAGKEGKGTILKGKALLKSFEDNFKNTERAA